jgi:hypothetical protein
MMSRVAQCRLTSDRSIALKRAEMCVRAIARASIWGWDGRW